jgi:hypothetical protein
MAPAFLEFPRLTVALSLPEPLVAAFTANFGFALAASPARPPDRAYGVRMEQDGVLLVRDGLPVGIFPDPQDLMFALEEDIENAIIEHLGEWVGLHAGAAVLGDAALVVVGRPDTGKTTTTFQLVELGLDLLCEEVAAIDPAPREVQPFPQRLTLARPYAEAFQSLYPVSAGALTFPTATMARYAATRVRTRPARLGAILFPRYDPSCQPAIEDVSPGQVLTELLQHCFTPALGDETLYDGVIRLITGCRLFRVHTRDIASARSLLSDLIARLA